MKKMIVSDFYGTLINSDEAIGLKTMLKIDKIRSKDILFVVASSKSFRSIYEYNNSYIFCDYIISYNGAHIYNVVSDEVIYKKNISLTILNKILKLKYKDIAFFTLNNTYYIGKNNNYDYAIYIDNLNDFIEFHKNDIYEIVIYGNKVKLKEIASELNKINVNYFIREGYIEIVYSRISKFFALNKILKKEKIKLEDVLSIGCDINDYEVLLNTYGTCVKDACSKIKKISKFVSNEPNTKGVLEILNKYIEE